MSRNAEVPGASHDSEHVLFGRPECYTVHYCSLLARGHEPPTAPLRRHVLYPYPRASRATFREVDISQRPR
jgi:hypothetical protein